MDIKQMLRDAINSEAAKILKEEYGIDFPSNTKEAVSKDQDSSCTYQAVLTERSGGVHREDIANIVESIHGSKSYANLVRTTSWPLVIARGLNYFAAVELKKSIVDKGGDVVIEEITKID